MRANKAVWPVFTGSVMLKLSIMVNKHCALSTCNNNSRYGQTPQMEDVYFIVFHKEKSKLETWMRACSRESLTADHLTRHTFICCRHSVGEQVIRILSRGIFVTLREMSADPSQLIGAGDSLSPPLQPTQHEHPAEAPSAATAQHDVHPTEAPVQPTPSSSAVDPPASSAGMALDPMAAKEMVFNLVDQLQQGGHMSGGDIQRLVCAFVMKNAPDELSAKPKKDDVESTPM